jgi:hypothetical protein
MKKPSGETNSPVATRLNSSTESEQEFNRSTNESEYEK